jgi:hypothetical protein
VRRARGARAPEANILSSALQDVPHRRGIRRYQCVPSFAEAAGGFVVTNCKAGSSPVRTTCDMGLRCEICGAKSLGNGEHSGD